MVEIGQSTRILDPLSKDIDVFTDQMEIDALSRRHPGHVHIRPDHVSAHLPHVDQTAGTITVA